MMDSVKCAGCGYLGVRHLHTQTLVSPCETHRKSGYPPEGFGPKANLDIMPVCAVGAYDLGGEVTSRNPAPAALVMQAQRQCSRFVTLIPALSPKEHLDMNLLQKQDDFYAQQEAENKKYRDGKDTADKKYRDTKDAEDRRWRWIELGVMGLAVTAISVAAQIVAALIERGILLRQN